LLGYGSSGDYANQNGSATLRADTEKISGMRSTRRAYAAAHGCALRRGSKRSRDHGKGLIKSPPNNLNAALALPQRCTGAGAFQSDARVQLRVFKVREANAI
jgi:hypothetical protein